jgi:hypothetical protein
MKAILSSMIVCGVVLAIGGGSASAADQLVKGKSFIVTDPMPGVDPTKRLISAAAKEIQSPETIVGNPTLPGGGGVLTVIANGGTPTSQVFNLPQGTNSTGKPYWVAVGATGFRYKDPKGDQGPVHILTIKRTPSAIFSIQAKVKGKNGTINVLPPNPGTDAFLTVSIDGGDRYCVKYGAEGKITNNVNKAFKVTQVEIEGCPP